VLIALFFFAVCLTLYFFVFLRLHRCVAGRRSCPDFAFPRPAAQGAIEIRVGVKTTIWRRTRSQGRRLDPMSSSARAPRLMPALHAHVVLVLSVFHIYEVVWL